MKQGITVELELLQYVLLISLIENASDTLAGELAHFTSENGILYKITKDKYENVLILLERLYEGKLK